MGTRRSHGNISFLLVLLLLFTVLVSKCSSFWFEPVTVHVKNDIGDGVWLDMHCMSDSDDLGQRSLRYGDEWHWKFLVNIIPPLTYFWCDFRWYDGNQDQRWYEGTFDVYHANGLINMYKKFCERDCQWSYRRDGAYLFRRDKGESGEWEKRDVWH
ncbi:hypothetical protein MKW94_005104 [Papaver nudicaule]|uniref:S-protein homolog n=1 Tax=Papaver nudicaule TaxID=74823 RepID=A0AA41VVY1_PAPNU|nr:hypothetical protein [Papaver nudicaule]